MIDPLRGPTPSPPANLSVLSLHPLKIRMNFESKPIHPILLVSGMNTSLNNKICVVLGKINRGA